MLHEKEDSIIKESGIPEEVLQYIPDTRLPLLDVRHSQELDLLKTGLQQVFKATQLDKKKAELKEYVMDPENGFAHVPAVLANVLEQLMKIKLPDFEAEKEVNMCEAIEQMIQDGVEEGRALGIQEGEARGKALGIDQGRQSELQEVCRSLFQLGTDESTIASLLHMRGLDAKQAAELMEQCRQKECI